MLWWSFFFLLLFRQLLLLLPGGAAHFARSHIFTNPPIIGQNLAVLANRHPSPLSSNWKPVRSEICVPDQNRFSPQNSAGELLFTFFFLLLPQLLVC